jgi:hypothetical protein
MAPTSLDALEALSVPRRKAQLLKRIPPARRALEEIVCTMGEGALNRPDAGGWRVRDHLSHIAAWERMLVAHLTTGDDHDVAHMSREEFARASLQQINDRFYEFHRDDTVSDVMTEFLHAHAALLAIINQLADKTMQLAYWENDPSHRPVIEKLAADTYRHYLEHGRWIAALFNLPR